MAKYAGADWLFTKYGPTQNPSDLGVAVADVLGQAWLGLYHFYEEGRLSHRVAWEDRLEIMLTDHGPLATWDASGLTRLLFCCLEWGLEVEIHGAIWHSYRMAFRWARQRSSVGDLESPIDALTLDGMCSRFGGRLLSRRDGTLGYREFAISSLSMNELTALVVHSHAACVRAEIYPRSSQSLRLMLSTRRREGGIIERHPILGQAKADLEPIYGVFKAVSV